MSEHGNQYSRRRCLSALSFWAEQAKAHGMTVTVTVTAKEKEAEKRELPPTPPIERKGEEKERSSRIATACARAKDCDAALTNEEMRLLLSSPIPEHRQLIRQYVAPAPTLARAVRHAGLRGCTDEAFVRKWYDCMDMSCWTDGYGHQILNWCYLLAKWMLNRDYFDKLQDPNRIPDAVSGGGRAGGKPVNWRGTRKEDLDAFFG